MRRIFLITGIVVGLLATPATGNAATTSLTVAGRLKGMKVGTEVMVVANDGTVVRATPKANGSFTIKVPNSFAKRMSPGKRGVGASIHLLSSGKYSGPVLLGKKSGTVGAARLNPSSSGAIGLGTIIVSVNGGVGAAKSTMLDWKNTVKLVNGKPQGSVQGAGARKYSVRQQDSLAFKDATVGGDADTDGVPNFADQDMNGDGITDAAQTDGKTTLSTSAIPAAVLGNRPPARVGLVKILNLNDNTQPVNSNFAPVTAESLAAYLSTQLSLEMFMQVDAADKEQLTVEIDCKQLKYCAQGNKTKIVDRPGSRWDQKTLDDGLFTATGTVNMIKSDIENRFYLHLKPGLASASQNNLAGDTFTITAKKGDAEFSSEVKTVTSSVVAAHVIVSANGKAIVYPQDGFKPDTYSSADLSALKLEFYRPQTLANGTTDKLIDRGGMFYKVYLMPFGGGGGMYVCQSKDMSALSSTLVHGQKDAYAGNVGLFDSEMSPSVNGAKLSVTLNVNGCLSNPSVGVLQGSPPTSGQTMSLEISADDSDSNQARSKIYLKLP